MGWLGNNEMELGRVSKAPPMVPDNCYVKEGVLQTPLYTSKYWTEDTHVHILDIADLGKVTREKAISRPSHPLSS